MNKMIKKTVKIGNAQGFWGDSPSAPLNLVKGQPDLDYLTLDYLSEVSMSILAIQREKDPNAGYARDFLDVIRSLIPLWQAGSKVKVVANAGGLNPKGCAEACKDILSKANCAHLNVGVVYGDDVLNILKASNSDDAFAHLETKEPLRIIKDRLVTANAYLGSEPIAELLKAGADIVITGRIADPSLTVGPCIANFDWDSSDYKRIAGATIAGHLIECGTQVTGGIATNWLKIPSPATIGFPIAEVAEDGSCLITKPPKTGGHISLETVKEQLLYEIGDPKAYLSPDATVSFLGIKLQVQCDPHSKENTVLVSGAIGSAPPPTYKVSATYRAGYRADAMLTVFGPEAVKKARLCGDMILQRVKLAGFDLKNTNIECIGAGDIASGVVSRPPDLLECVLKVSVSDERKEAVEYFTKEIAPLVTSGPQGVTGYTSGRPKVRPVFGYWPCLIDTAAIKPKTLII